MNKKLDYNAPVKVADGIYWVGFYDEKIGLHCNPYLIIEGDEAVLIDGGSRKDFPSVMMKILKTGLVLNSIKALIYQHYDPDLCGSLPNLENIIDNDNLKILSTHENHMFISHYSVATNIVNINELNYEFTFKTGRKLKFILTPFAHAAGSFVTLDEQTKVLFTSDLFGSYGGKWELFSKIDKKCFDCSMPANCLDEKENCIPCDLVSLYNFHRRNFPTVRSLEYAISQIEKLDFSMLAPQHGGILDKPTAILLFDKLRNLDGVGIDKYIK